MVFFCARRSYAGARCTDNLFVVTDQRWPLWWSIDQLHGRARSPQGLNRILLRALAARQMGRLVVGHDAGAGRQQCDGGPRRRDGAPEGRAVVRGPHTGLSGPPAAAVAERVLSGHAARQCVPTPPYSAGRRVWPTYRSERASSSSSRARATSQQQGSAQRMPTCRRAGWAGPDGRSPCSAV